MEGIRKCLLARAEKGLIHLSVQTWAAQTFGLPFSAIEGAILEMGLLPARYQRSQQSLSCRQQLSLFRGKVAAEDWGATSSRNWHDLVSVISP